MPLITDLVNNVLDISTKFCLHQDEHTDEEQFLNMKLKKKETKSSSYIHNYYYSACTVQTLATTERQTCPPTVNIGL